ncbi:MAG: hypothetical protein AB1805_00300 [Nitrospirota bacterium]
MRGGRITCIAVLGIALFLAGCASPARFTHDEIKHYPIEIQEKIIKGQIAPGMTPQQVRYAWGAPDSVRTLQPEAGKPKEEWIYTSGIGLLRTVLTFIDGKLTYIVSSEPGRMK